MNTKKPAKKRLAELEESLPSLERQLEHHVAAAYGIATKIDQRRHPSRAAEKPAQYGKARR